MPDKDFLDWGRNLGFAEEALAEIDRISSIPVKKKTVLTDCIYSPESIIDLWETDGIRIDPASSEFAIVGGCANGDPIAMSFRTHEIGSVWYIAHGRMHDGDLRELSIKVSDSISRFYRDLCEDSGFPHDFYSASNRSRG